MKTVQEFEKDLASIKDVMERSTKFISLSGLTGILAGTYALLGSLVAYYLVYYPSSPFGFRFHYVNEEKTIVSLLATATFVLTLSLLTGYYFTYQKAKKKNQKIWSKSSERLLSSMATPLVAGGLFILILLSRGYFMVIAPASLLFYGLALVNGSAHTFSDVKYLGFCQILLALLCGLMPGYGLIFWALGFGVLHIVYGISMHYKYDR
jgi:hypothetical protein